MNSNCRELFSLIAMGRLTPAEAERLFLVLNHRREVFEICMVCLFAFLFFLLLAQGKGGGFWEGFHWAQSLLSGDVFLPRRV